MHWATKIKSETKQRAILATILGILLFVYLTQIIWFTDTIRLTDGRTPTIRVHMPWWGAIFWVVVLGLYTIFHPKVTTMSAIGGTFVILGFALFFAPAASFSQMDKNTLSAFFSWVIGFAILILSEKYEST